MFLSKRIKQVTDVSEIKWLITIGKCEIGKMDNQWQSMLFNWSILIPMRIPNGAKGKIEPQHSVLLKGETAR